MAHKISKKFKNKSVRDLKIKNIEIFKAYNIERHT